MEREKTDQMFDRNNQEFEKQYTRKDATTFYISNIHPKVSDSEFWIECRNYGHLVDAYIARKRDKWGKCFGFLRFVNIKDGEKMAKSLNNIEFYRWRVKAKVARFVKIEKKSAERGKQIWDRKEKAETKVMNVTEIEDRSRIKEGMSYADTVRGIRSQAKENEVMRFTNESEAFKEWKNKALLCEFHSINHLKNADKCVMDLRIEKGVMRYLGGLKVLITFSNVEDMEPLASKKEERWKDWFHTMGIWKGQLLPYQRIAWLKIRGAPIQLWMGEVMNVIAGKFGRIVQSSEADKYDLNLQFDVNGRDNYAKYGCRRSRKVGFLSVSSTGEQ
ncbi:putative RNA recognition motif domain, nucleotide-binding alpha-beta plait domain superfamily [Helianthus annuus]|nr:putative RNA recognition motif domain, nucleotide-binding alpha-beta plait domain superfamily [Helianthus annuus]